MNLIEISTEDAWRGAVVKYPTRDVYHTFEYNRASATDPRLLVVGDDESELAWPLIARCGSLGGEEYLDAASVYGYPGPIFRGCWTEARIRDAWREIEHWCMDQGFVSLMSRLNPFSDSLVLLRDIGQTIRVNTTVAIDTTRSEDEQWSAIRENHRRGIRKLKRKGAICQSEPWAESLPDFISVYRDTMRALSADKFYFFDDKYFEDLASATDFDCRIYVCRYEGNVIAAGMFLFGDNYCHYHLGGTSRDYLKLAPTKLVFDTVRNDCARKGMKALHLGGGVGGQEDSLLNFKRGFSDVTLQYHVFGAIVDTYRYSEMTAIRRSEAATNDGDLDPNYFPAYRAPIIKAQ